MEDSPRPQWWVGQTPDGLRAFPYRSNSRLHVAGPFLDQTFADLYIAEQEQARDQRRAAAELTLAVVVSVVVVAVIL